ncbi:CocE/NonD family hydrolase [Pelagibacterium lacus]|uniref:CocE/NonD family hydrolase n=1 Tax=Pelagibacterium lacus TaxID=2282655 RepID=A0A369W4M3_9HYPH|nr:CocE/NonD family hydrolase [Pelagibacterium lacus]RDE08212.1 CocE/NonD family hydrolase [Pelagibacterium lacus]
MPVVYEVEKKNKTGHDIVMEHDVDVPMRDGATLKANVFRPKTPGKYPVIITLGPYGKDLHFSNHRKDTWDTLVKNCPDVFEHSTGKWMAFETPDPEVWVPHGYVTVRVDSRGLCKSPGKMDVNSPQEFADYYDAIEWAGTQSWSSGKVGLLGISYFACGQWMVSSLRPPHLAAIQPWQGTSDFYRGRTRTGGMFCDGFVHFWWARNLQRQHGNPNCDLVDMVTGERLSGSGNLSEEELRANRFDYIQGVLDHPLCDEYYTSRSGDLSQVSLPALVVANWGGLGLHLRGTVTGFMGLASEQKWLKIQSGSYFATFFQPESVLLQRKFFDRYLKDEDNGWESEPRVEVMVRGPGDSVAETLTSKSWPLDGTSWQKLYLNAPELILDAEPAKIIGETTYPALSEGVTFATGPLETDLTLAGPFKAHLHVSCDKPDMDLFATIQAFDPDGDEVTFAAADEPKLPVSQGWLRVTHRKLDDSRTTDWMPWHAHDEEQPLTPGHIYQIEVEIWPASIALTKGSRLSLTLQGKDFERPGATGKMKGSGLFTHNDPTDRPVDRFNGNHTIYTGGDYASYLQVPVIASS